MNSKVLKNDKKHLIAQMTEKKTKDMKVQMKDDTPSSSQDALTSADIDIMLQEEETLKARPLPYIKIFGKKINIDSLVIGCFGLLLWILIWKFLNIFDIGWYTYIFFVFYIIILLLNIFVISLTAETNIEIATYGLEKQTSNTEAAMGVIIILFVFLYNIQMNSQNRDMAFKLLTVVMVFCTFAIIKYSTANDTGNMRIVRLITQKLYNQSIVLFALSFIVIYLGIINK
jgi:hypothetical protein